ncbi:MAG: hypothetical protein RLZZ231_817 [Bacteroidota bacterium]|jgi:hypothetical protein
MKNIKLLFVVLLVSFVLFYLNLPVINFGFTKLPVLLLIVVILVLVLSTGINVLPNGKKIVIQSKPSKIYFYVIGLILFYLIALPLLTSTAMFRTEAYKNMIGKVTNGTKIAKHIEPISINEIRVVDEDLAYLLGEKILGSQPALGSQVELGEFYIQKVGNDLYWVAPLLHSGFFKWLNNSEGTPGYVMVSATNERDVKLVQNVGGKDVKIKYQPAAFFQSDIKRHIYMNGNATVGLTDFTFEIDDQGNPFWVVTTFNKEIGFSGDDATGVIVVDVKTGTMQSYAIENTPAWVDRIQPISFVEKQLNDWGDYVHGYWNFSNSDKLQITEGLTLVYGKNNRSYWYTGLTSVGKDESAVGFVLVDTRTKETTFYKQSGATEFAAQSSAEGKVQEKGYHSSLPIPYNINGIPTYVMTLKDDGGLVKMFAMVAISDYTIVGAGNSMRETLTAFKNAYNSSGSKMNATSVTDKKGLKTVITRIQTDVKNGNSYYYFTLQNNPSIFVGSSQISSQLPISMVGDSVEVTFDVDKEEVVDVTTFKNLSLKR